MHQMIRLAIVFAVSYLLLSVVPTIAQTIKQINYSGSGCPQGTVDTFLSNDKKAVTLIFDQLLASSEERKKKCSLTINLDSPSKALIKAEVRGSSRIAAGVGAQESMIFSQGTYEQSSSESFQGPGYVNYLSQITILNTAQDVRSSFSISLEVTLHGQGSGEITIDSLDIMLSP